MLDHVSITVRNFAAASRFYDAVFAVLDAPCVWREATAIGYGERNCAETDGHTYLTIRYDPCVAAGDLDSPRRHWCFRASSRASVDLFHAAGIAAGGSSDGPPGIRADYHPSYYAAFLLDPDGNRIEAVCHRPA